MFYIYHRLTNVLMLKTKSIDLINQYNPEQYQVVIY
jgi:hypothetical protein